MIIKPLKTKIKPDTMDIEDDFYKHSHALHPITATNTLCGIADEEWNCVNCRIVKKVTCPECLEIIDFCKSI